MDLRSLWGNEAPMAFVQVSGAGKSFGGRAGRVSSHRIFLLPSHAPALQKVFNGIAPAIKGLGRGIDNIGASMEVRAQVWDAE